jgi:ATP-dependent Clp protease protease subunit
MVKKNQGKEMTDSKGPEDIINPKTPAPNPNPTLRDKGIYFLSGGFNPDTAEKVVTWILEANFAAKRPYDNLTLIINSPGGEVSSAFAIIDAMRGSAIPVHTVGLGLIGSCGLLTFIAGEKGHRVLTPNTSILSHQWSWGSRGKEHELFAVVREFDLTNDRMLAHYRNCTGLSDQMIREKLLPAHDVWLSAEEAKALNICDEIKDMGQKK